MTHRARSLPSAGQQLSNAEAEGLYRSDYEHDACGVAFVADLTGRRDHAIVAKALVALRNLEHRGARGAEPDTGDGAGLLIQIPDEFYREVVDFELPEPGTYAVGTAFLPLDEKRRGRAMTTIERIAAEEDMRVLGWRELPVHTEHCGPTAAETMPHFTQLFLTARRPKPEHSDPLHIERSAFCVRKRAEHELVEDDVYFPQPVVAHDRLQRNAHRAAGRAVLRRPDRRARHQRHRPRALPLLHQHLPVVAARAPVPLRRAQRRDQHPARQPQLDGRPRGPARDRPRSRATSSGSTR